MIHLVLFKFTPCDLSEVCHSSYESILKSLVIVIGLSARLSLIEFVTLRLQTKLKLGTAGVHRQKLLSACLVLELSSLDFSLNRVPLALTGPSSPYLPHTLALVTTKE